MTSIENLSERNTEISASIKESFSTTLEFFHTIMKHEVFGLTSLYRKIELCETTFESKNSTIILARIGDSAATIKHNCDVYSKMIDYMINVTEAAENLKECIDKTSYLLLKYK